MPTSTSKRGNEASKSSQIRDLLSTGLRPKEIAERVGCTPTLVSVVKWSVKNADKGRVAQQPKVSTRPSTDGLAGIADLVKSVEQDRARLRQAMQRIQELVADALAT